MVLGMMQAILARDAGSLLDENRSSSPAHRRRILHASGDTEITVLSPRLYSKVELTSQTSISFALTDCTYLICASPII